MPFPPTSAGGSETFFGVEWSNAKLEDFETATFLLFHHLQPGICSICSICAPVIHLAKADFLGVFCRKILVGQTATETHMSQLSPQNLEDCVF